MRDWSGNRIPMYRVTGLGSRGSPSPRCPSGCEGLVVAFAVAALPYGHDSPRAVARSERHLGDSPARGVMVVPVPCRNRSHGPHRVWRVRAGVVRLPACSPGRRARAVEGAHELLAHITLGLVLLISRRHFLVRRENLV